MKTILVTGANGQLGKCLQDIAPTVEGVAFVFEPKEVLDIANKQLLEDYFSNKNFDYCVNAAAYTNVEQAEKEEEKAFKINAEGAKNLAEVCKIHNMTLIHISTDYVFDGTKQTPYTETDKTNPINTYGASKLKGEEAVATHCPSHYIIRTSWLYSQYGHNFLNTILKHAKAGNPLTITTEQTGAPTNANDLASVIVEIIMKDPKKYGLYHFSNGGQATWFDFAKEILEQSGLYEKTNLAETDYYPTFAKRPRYTVMNTKKIEQLLDTEMLAWNERIKCAFD